MDIKTKEFRSFCDARGSLTVLEECEDIPFNVKRVYYMYNTRHEEIRGCHAHKKLEQILICVHGSCKIRLDDGLETRIIELSNPAEGGYVANNVWREMFDFSQDAVLLVLASEVYDEKDYIRDYDAFLKYVGKMK